jgi:uncharacterized membrane protein YraQ (UPF0718 family)
MADFMTVFLALIFETTPFLLAGVLISVVAGPSIERVLATAAFRSPALATLAGVGAGLVLPMCDCGSRPLAHRLALAGRREFAMAFLVAAPVLNPIVIVTTWLAFRDPELLALRLGVTAVTATVAAIVLARFVGPLALAVEGEREPSAHEHGLATLRSAPGRALAEFFELFQFLVVGAALAALLQTAIDRDSLTGVGGVYAAAAAMMALAFLLSICSSVDAFVAAGLGGGLGTGPVLAFLAFGPIVNLKSTPMYLRLFDARAVVVLTVIVAEIVFGVAVVAELRGW